jgi:hypothetical protein
MILILCPYVKYELLYGQISGFFFAFLRFNFKAVWSLCIFLNLQLKSGVVEIC